MGNSRQFDRAAKYYDETRLLLEPIAKVGIPAILELLVPNARVLEVGSGTGRISIPLLERGVDLLALDEALERLAAFNPEGARIVKLRFFGGLSNEEVADVLASSERTVRRQWSVAKAWLRRELGTLVHDGSSLSSLAGGA